MIIVYEKSTGQLVRFIVGQCVNPTTHEIDGYLAINPGGKFPNVAEGQSVFNFDEVADPMLADEVASDIYRETGRFYVAEVDGVKSLVEVADG